MDNAIEYIIDRCNIQIMNAEQTIREAKTLINKLREIHRKVPDVESLGTEFIRRSRFEEFMRNALVPLYNEKKVCFYLLVTMVLTAVGKYAYQRKNGIYVVPIGCLKD